MFDFGEHVNSNIQYSVYIWTLKLAHASTYMVEGFLSSYACMQAWCERKGFDTVIHLISKCVIFLEDLLQEMVDKKSKDPFGTIKVARKALSKIRWCPHIIWLAGSLSKTGRMPILRLLGSELVSNNSSLIDNTPVAKLYLSHIHHYFPLCDWVRRMQRATRCFHHSLQIWSQCFDDHIARFYLAFDGCISMS